MEAKEKGAVLDAEAEAFLANVECTSPYDEPLAITTTNVFEVSHEDAYDSDVDDGPNATATFMANLSSTNGASTSNVNEIHHEEHLDSDVDSDIDDNTIPYHQYQIDSEVKSVPIEVSSVSPGEISMITILDDLRTQLDGHLKVNQEQSLVNDSLRAELEKCKLEMQTLRVKLNTPIKNVFTKSCFPEFDKVSKDRTTPSYITNGEWHFEHTKKCLVEEIIPFYEKLKTHVKGIEDNLFKEVSKYMKIFDELDKEYDQCVIDKKNLEIENKTLLIQNECLLAESVSKDIFSVVLTSDIVVPMSIEPRSNCVEEHSRNLELEAKILKVKQLLVEKEKRCSFIETKYQ
ncbi:hypothetical protein Tco_0565973 [Tanacetum coccineum]